MSASRRRGRGTVVLVAAGVAVALLVVSTRSWISVEVADPLGSNGSVAVRGSRAAALVPALALVGLASAGALTIARRVGRVVALAAMALSGAGALAASLGVVTNPSRAARAAIAEATGVTPGSVGDDTATTALTVWPVAAAALALLLVAVAVYGWTTRRGWESSSRFEAGTARAERTTTGPQDVAAAAGVPEPDADVAAGGREVADTWDALSRGDDPTRDRD